MIIKAYYSDGRIGVFDTDRMTDGVPQPENLLTNYTLDLSDVSGESLWLCSYYYEATQAYKDEKGPKDLPVARRRNGWSFLLADAEDMQRLNRVTVDGETIFTRVAGEFIDIATLTGAFDIVERYAPMIYAAYASVALISGDCSNIDDAIGAPSTVLLKAIESCAQGSIPKPRF